MKLLAFGDSNTYGYDPRSYFGGRYGAESRWVDVLAAKTGWEIVNAGENGREIPKRSWEFEDFSALLQVVSPVDGMLVLLGGNDLLQGASVGETAERMERFLREAVGKIENITLIGPPLFSLGAWIADDALIDASKELAAAYRLLAERLGLRFVDASSLNIDLTFDGVHFSEAGHRALGEKLAEELQ